MRWSRFLAASAAWRNQGSRSRRIPALVGLLILAALVIVAAPENKQISVYSTAANYSLPVLEKNGQDYVGLLEMLEPLGTVSAKADGSRWKFRYNDVDSEFSAA